MKHPLHPATAGLRRGPGWGILVYGVVLLGPDAAAYGQDAANGFAPTDLKTLLVEYFRSDTPDCRSTVAANVANRAAGSFERVAAALSDLPLWAPIAEPEGRLEVQWSDRGRVALRYSLPTGYDHSRAWPLLLWLPGVARDDESLMREVRLRGGRSLELIILVPDRPVDGRFFEIDRESNDLRAFVRTLRRTFHVDTERTYVIGAGIGGQRAWFGAMTCPDLFAGAMVIDANPQLPYPWATYPMYFRNLAGLPFVSIRTRGALEPGNVDNTLLTATRHRRIAELARAMNLPIRTITVEAEPDAPPKFVEISDQILSARRPSAPRRLSHWFRYPELGRAYWLAATALSREPWAHEQISILPGATVDRVEFVADTLKSFLFYLGATVADQAIDITTHGCAEIELAIPAGLVDLTRPVTVTCNGVKRHEGLIHPSISTLLDRAYAEWEFSRPIVATLRFRVARDGAVP